MKIHESVQNIIEVLTTYSAKRLSDPDSLAMLLQYAGDAGRHSDLAALCFRGKHLSRVFGAMTKQTPETELYAKLQEEFSVSAKEFHALLGNFVTDAPAELREVIERDHLAVTPEALHRLMHLARDLEWLKNWELDMALKPGDA